MEEQTLIRRLISKVQLCKTLEELEQHRVDLLGRGGLITALFSKLKGLSKQECQKLGQELNELKGAALEAIASQSEKLEQIRVAAFLEQDWCDVTLPGKPRNLGQVHPISKAKNEVLDILSTFGFKCESGPEIEDEWHNFTALNMQECHPARQMVDTFYLKEEKKLLRTHTSTVQIRAMEGKRPPFQFVSSGRVYRRDSDSTHTPMFHQVEGVLINKTASFANLKFLLSQIVNIFFEGKMEMRIRPSFFPFTSPSIELDIRENKNASWMEIAGAGMVHPKVLENLNIEPSWQGFAFGLGIDRLAMIKFGISDIRQCFEGDLRWLQHYGLLSL
jgi:phenylalanyl-tRNA synthetase alpha chain